MTIPSSGDWPDGDTLDVVATEDLLLQRAARMPSSHVLGWLTPFEDVIVAPDRLPAMIAEIRAAIVAEPTLAEARAADRLVRFLQQAHTQGRYLRLIDSP